MLFVYLDEFGHVGPFVGRTAPKYKESPVFGLAGIILPSASVRGFSSAFLQLKQHALGAEIASSGKIGPQWEKKGTSIFRPKTVSKYSAMRNLGLRLTNIINNHGGKVFYYGREKIVGKTNGNPNGFYTTILSHTIRRIDDYCTSRSKNFALVLDEHSARKELLECASKTMYGDAPARRLVSPPFEMESYLNQNIQAADWIATIVGRLWMHEVQPGQYQDHAQMRTFYWARLHQLTVQSTVETRAKMQR